MRGLSSQPGLEPLLSTTIKMPFSANLLESSSKFDQWGLPHKANQLFSRFALIFCFKNGFNSIKNDCFIDPNSSMFWAIKNQIFWEFRSNHKTMETKKHQYSNNCMDLYTKACNSSAQIGQRSSDVSDAMHGLVPASIPSCQSPWLSAPTVHRLPVLAWKATS